MPSATFSATVSEFEQREMLEHHADAEPAGVRRALDRHLLAAPDDLAGVRARDAVDDLDQRALAGAVLAQQRVNLGRADRQIDAVVGETARILFGDAVQRQGRAGHGRRSIQHFAARLFRSSRISSTGRLQVPGPAAAAARPLFAPLNASHAPADPPSGQRQRSRRPPDRNVCSNLVDHSDARKGRELWTPRRTMDRSSSG